MQKRNRCPLCFSRKEERECILEAEEVLGVPLAKTRVYYDSENNRKFIEFDGFNQERRVAVEYNGIQHYRYVKLYHKSRHDFADQIRRDELKREFCKGSDILLIEVPYSERDRKEFIMRKAGIS